MTRTNDNLQAWGLLEGEEPIAPFWAGVVDPDRSRGAKFGRALAHVFLPGRLRNAVLKPERVFQFAITTGGVLVVSGLTAEPVRIEGGAIRRLEDNGRRRSMRTVVAGKLAGVAFEDPQLGSLKLLVPEGSLGHLVRLAAGGAEASEQATRA